MHITGNCPPPFLSKSISKNQKQIPSKSILSKTKYPVNYPDVKRIAFIHYVKFAILIHKQVSGLLS